MQAIINCVDFALIIILAIKLRRDQQAYDLTAFMPPIVQA